MVLQYKDILGDGKSHKIKATITTDHPSSSYGMPVVVLPDGQSLDATSWVLLGYRVVSCGKTESRLMVRWLDNIHAMLPEIHEGG